MTCGRCNGDGEVTKSDGIRVECIRCHGSGRVANATVVSDYDHHRNALVAEMDDRMRAISSAVARMGCVRRSYR